MASIVIFITYAFGVLTVTHKIPPYKTLKAIHSWFLPKDQPLYVRSYYSRHKSMLFAASSYQADIVMLGDSLTDHAEWHELLSGVSVANRGVAGETTSDVLQRINSVTQVKPKKIFIMLGNNDFNRGLSAGQVFKNYQLIVQQLQLSAEDIYIQSTLLTAGRDKKLNQSINKLNELLQEYSSKSTSIHYIDLNKVLAPGGFLSEAYSLDGVHLNASGYALWRDAILLFCRHSG